MPAEFVAFAVAVCPDSGAQFFRLGDQLLPRHFFKVFVHGPSGAATLVGPQVTEVSETCPYRPCGHSDQQRSGSGMIGVRPEHGEGEDQRCERKSVQDSHSHQAKNQKGGSGYNRQYYRSPARPDNNARRSNSRDE
jgi:hypothetical protein